jgi:hypothetical protein
LRHPLHVVIISWIGQHVSARAIAASIADEADRLSVIYSHPDRAEDQGAGDWYSVPDEQFFGPKFAKALQLTEPGEAMLLVHADTDYHDWSHLLRRCRAAYETVPQLAIWAPDFTYTPWTTELVRLPIQDAAVDPALVPVVQTDGIIVAFCPATLNRLRMLDCAGNNLGWGIDWAALAFAYAGARPVLRDTSIKVTHQKGRGYGRGDAQAEMQQFFARLTVAERQQIILLHGFFRLRQAQSGSALARALRAVTRKGRADLLAV